MRGLLIADAADTPTTAVPSGEGAVALDEPWALNPRVSIRPERFGALAYHFGNRRLSFLRHPDLVKVAEGLAGAESVADALRSAGVAEARWPSFQRALGTLAESDMVVRRTSAAVDAVSLNEHRAPAESEAAPSSDNERSQQ